MNRDLWLSALADIEPAPDPEALTSADIGVMLGLKATATKVRIRQLIADGKVRVVPKRITDAVGRTHTVQAYKLVQSEDACVPRPRATPKPSTGPTPTIRRSSRTSTSKH